MSAATPPKPFSQSLITQFMHSFLEFNLLHSAVEGPDGQWFVQISPTERIHHLTDSEDAFDFIGDILAIVDEANGPAL